MALAAATNVLKAWVLVLGLAATFGAIGWAIGAQRGALLFVFCSLLAALTAYAFGDRALLGMLGAKPFALAQGPLVHSTVDRLSAQAGVLAPKLYLIDDLFPRAFVVGRGPRSSGLALSTGMLSALPPAELEAVIAHELAHIRCRDVLTQTFAVLLASTVLETARLGGWLSRGLLYVLAPVASAITHLLLSPRRETAADVFAASIAGWENIADAILRLDQAGALVQFTASPATEPLYLVSPFAEEGVARMFVTHPPVERRTARLQALSTR